MTQRQKDQAPFATAPDTSLRGNPEAAEAAQKARDTLAIETKPAETWQGHLMGSVIVKGSENGCGIHGANAFDQLDAHGKISDIEHLILRGWIDPETMRWTDKAFAAHQAGWICFCLEPGCNIGHFIPVRR